MFSFFISVMFTYLQFYSILNNILHIKTLFELRVVWMNYWQIFGYSRLQIVYMRNLHIMCDYLISTKNTN